MFTTITTNLRRLSGHTFTALACTFALGVAASGQTPLVVSSSVSAVPHNQVLGAPWQTAVSNRGDFLVFDFKTGALYEFPANGGPQITIGAPNALAGGFTDSGIAIDPRNNNIYLDNNYNGGLQRLPFNPVTGAWDLPPVTVAQGLAGNLGGGCGNYFQSAGLSMNSKGVLAVATENGCGVEIFTVPIDAAGNFGAASPVVSNMKGRAKTLAIDDAGNISWNEDSGRAGALFVPAGTTGLTSDATVSRIDPMLGNVQGVATDKAGNIYVGDGTAGTYLVPLEAGVPNPAHAVLLSTASVNGNTVIDEARGVMFSPTNGFNSIVDVIRIYQNRLEFAAQAVTATSATAGVVNYTFSGAVTPHSFVVQEAGAVSDFAVVTGGTCAADTAYAANGTCTLNVSFTPHTVGDVSASLAMLDSTGNVLVSTVLHGVGQGSSIVMSPATELPVGSGLVKPAQIATDASGNMYVADNGAGMVLQYAKGSGSATVGTSVGTGLVAPTGVAVDGAGDVFIADSGQVIKVPVGASGLAAAGQGVLKAGFGTKLTVAADGTGTVYVADPDNQRVARLRGLVGSVAESDLTGFAQLTAITVDGSGNLYIANGQNLIKVPAFGKPSVVFAGLPSGVNGLAVDASGAVYVSSTNVTTRIPNEAGTLNAGDQFAIATSVTHPVSVAVDTVGNAYVVDGTAKNIDTVNANGSLNLGTLTTPSSTASGTVTIVNDGNLPLNVTGFVSTPDFSETASSCVGAAVNVGLSCTATITFSPGPGDQGKLTGNVGVLSDAGNAPIGVNVVGTGAALAVSTTAVTITKPTVTNDQVVVTVASASGTGAAPTGNVTLTVTPTGTTPLKITKALVNGTVTFTPSGLKTGTYTYSVVYLGDRVYGTSAATTTATITSGSVILVQPAASAVPKYVLSTSRNGAQPPFDNSQVPFLYSYPLVVKTADGSALIGPPITVGGNQTGVDYGVVTYSVASGKQACSGTSGAINVNADGTAPLGTQCLDIDTSNNQIPNISTTYTITPMYSGNTNPNYGPVTGTPFTVTALRNPSVTISSNPAALSVTQGGSASATLTVTSLLGYGVTGAAGNLNNYTLPVELECDALPAHASCSFSYPTPDPSDPNSTAVTPAAPGVVKMTLNTNVPVGTTASVVSGKGTALAVLLGFGVLGLSSRRRRTLRQFLLTAACVLACGVMIAGVTACSSKQFGSAPVLNTPSGSYTISVTAKQTGSKVVIVGGAPVTISGNHNLMSVPFTMNVTVQ